MTQRELTIGFLSANPPTDRKASSGTAFSVYRQIARIGGGGKMDSSYYTSVLSGC